MFNGENRITLHTRRDFLKYLGLIPAIVLLLTGCGTTNNYIVSFRHA